MATVVARRTPPAPTVDPGNRAFFDAAREGRLLIGRCLDTGKHFFYPRASSPFTLSPNVELVQARGMGTLYSFSITRVKEPYAVAYVELDEGPRVLTNIVDCDLDALRIGQRMRVVWQPTADGGPPVAMFTPA